LFCLNLAGDFAAVVKELLALAEKGSPTSMYLLGAHYGSGQGVDKDPVESEKWFRKAKAAGSIEGAYRLGLVLQGGQSW